MNSQKKNTRKRKSSLRNKKGPGLIGIIFIIVFCLGTGVFLAPYINQVINDSQTVNQQKDTLTQSPPPEVLPNGNTETKDTSPISKNFSTPHKQESVVESLGEKQQDELTAQEDTKITCADANSSITSFYKHLDTQKYIREFKLEKKSSSYFTDLIQKLVDNPPVVTRETDDLFTILQNTAHFFRIIGKNNITIIKGILHQEKDLFEDILSNYYHLAVTPDCSQQNISLTFPENSLYDYAGFFLNTMGGRLYLFRRDSHSRMVIIYYALMIIDKANIDGKNRHGIQINQSLDSLITEIETVGTHLNKRELYLDKLYDLKERYQ